MAVRVTQEQAEALRTGNPTVRTTEAVLEALVVGTRFTRVTQACLEVLIPNEAAPAPSLPPMRCLMGVGM
jgi:hypothetical protein